MPKYGPNIVRDASQLLFVEATDTKGQLTVLLDSGAETGFSYHYFTKHRNELSQLRGTKEIVGGTVDGFHSTMALHVPSVKFSVCNQELEMKDVYLPYMKGSSTDWHDIALGIDFFRQYDYVTLNFKKMF